MSAPAIALRALRVEIGTTIVLEGIDLTVESGERLCIIGPNGAGKSTLLKVLTGTAPGRMTGLVRVLGHELSLPLSRHRQRVLQAQVGQVFQTLQLVPRLSVLENVLIGALARVRSPLTWARLFPAAEITLAQQALQTVGMGAMESVRADHLSGGQRQKVAVARMLMQQPGLILADEPTAALDPAAAVEVANLLTSCAIHGGIAMVSVVHDPALISLLAERVVGMRDGRIVFDLLASDVNDAMLASLYGGPITDARSAPHSTVTSSRSSSSLTELKVLS